MILRGNGAIIRKEMDLLGVKNMGCVANTVNLILRLLLRRQTDDKEVEVGALLEQTAQEQEYWQRVVTHEMKTPFRKTSFFVAIFRDVVCRI